jgi:hypothetical protein
MTFVTIVRTLGSMIKTFVLIGFSGWKTFVLIGFSGWSFKEEGGSHTCKILHMWGPLKVSP